jgi:Fe2+ transport system protein FeoA
MEAVNFMHRVTALSNLPTGEHGQVHSLHGGHLFCSRAANLGFTAGTDLKVVQNYGRGPMLVALRGTLVALGRNEAARVMVEGTRALANGNLAQQNDHDPVSGGEP